MGMGWISFLQLHVLQAWLSHRFSRLQITLAIPFDAQMTQFRPLATTFHVSNFGHSFISFVGPHSVRWTIFLTDSSEKTRSPIRGRRNAQPDLKSVAIRVPLAAPRPRLLPA
jgi:hypothetical protein